MTKADHFPWRASLLALVSLFALALMPATAAVPDAGITAAEFRQAIAKRDRIILELMRRVEDLEKRMGTGRPAKGQPPARDRAPNARAGSKPPGQPGVQPPEGSEPSVSVDDLTAQRALERSLVDQGAVLLRRGQAELVPSFSFQRRESVSATAVVIGPDTFVANDRTDMNVFDAQLAYRQGLPWSSQLELSLPYRLVTTSDTIDVSGSIVSSDDSSGSGIGDLRVGLANTLVEGKGSGPDLVGRINATLPTGKKTDGGIGLGFGFYRLGGDLTALYRQDPLVFFGTAGYEYVFEDDNLQPGEAYTLGLGTSLAVSPETSLSFSLNQRYRDDLQVGGTPIDGSDRLETTFNFGTSMILSKRLLLRVNAGIGLTEDAPDYTLGFSFPIRFASPI